MEQNTLCKKGGQTNVSCALKSNQPPNESVACAPVDTADSNTPPTTCASSQSKLDYSQYLDDNQFQLEYTDPVLEGALDLLDFTMPGTEEKLTCQDVLNLNNTEFSDWQTSMTRCTKEIKNKWEYYCLEY